MIRQPAYTPENLLNKSTDGYAMMTVIPESEL
jgi:hypothetical protein